MKHATHRGSSLVKNILPDYFQNKNVNDKLALVENAELNEDNIQMNLLADDSYLELDSLSYLDQEQLKNLPLEQRLSLLMRADSEKVTSKNSNKAMKIFYKNNAGSLIWWRTEVQTDTPKISENERLLDALDSIDDNLTDGNSGLSFNRISLLELTDRNSIVHGPSFKGNKESTDRLSRKSSRKSKLNPNF
jgi:hypothetical protein